MRRAHKLLKKCCQLSQRSQKFHPIQDFHSVGQSNISPGVRTLQLQLYTILYNTVRSAWLIATYFPHPSPLVLPEFSREPTMREQSAGSARIPVFPAYLTLSVRLMNISHAIFASGAIDIDIKFKLRKFAVA